MLDIEIYRDILVFIHATAGGEGVEILFRILSCHSKGSELLVMSRRNLPYPVSCKFRYRPVLKSNVKKLAYFTFNFRPIKPAFYSSQVLIIRVIQGTSHKILRIK